MKDEILNNLDNPGELEKLYRGDKAHFKQAFYLVYPGIKEKTIARAWHERLSYESERLSRGTNRDVIFTIAASFLAGLIAKIPDFFKIDPEYFYPRNAGFIVFPLLAAYFARNRETGPGKLLIISTVILLSALYINALPLNPQSDTLMLACLHLPLLLWTISGFTFVGGELKNSPRRLDFLKYNGDLVVMTTLILISGMLLTGATVGLFKLIDVPVEELYFRYVGIWGLASAPIVATYLVRANPQLVGRVSPVIAKVFTPLVLVMLLVYLSAVIYTGKDPYNDREFLLIFNLLLVGVMAIILFSVTEISRQGGNKAWLLLLLALSVVTILINGIALSAILFRISEWGITPNRLAVSGSNVLMLANLILVAYRLFRTLQKGGSMKRVEESITYFLPVYGLWAALVTFVFPVLFGFR